MNTKTSPQIFSLFGDNPHKVSKSCLHLHTQAVELSKNIRAQEAELLKILRQMDEQRLYLEFGYRSLFEYTVESLQFSEHRALNFISVARLCKKVPELQKEIEDGLGISKARKLSAVLTPDNKTEWFLKAKSLSQKLLEREVSAVCPKELVHESSRYVAKDRLKLILGISEEGFETLKRVLDLESQRQKKAVSIEDALSEMMEIYLEKRDPLRKAKQITMRKVEAISEKKRTLKPDQNLKPTVSNCTKSSISCVQEKEKRAIDGPFSLSSSSLTPLNQVSQIPSRKKFETLFRLESSKNGKSFVARRVKRFTRETIPAAVQHQVLLRDQGTCQFPTKTSGNHICGQKRWIHLHHIVPVAKGGPNTLENLSTLCSAHHKLIHTKSAIAEFYAGQFQSLDILRESGISST